jgi:hypothetical protein
MALLGYDINEVLADPQPLADVDLDFVRVTTLVQRGEYHLLEHAAGAGVPRRHRPT